MGCGASKATTVVSSNFADSREGDLRTGEVSETKSHQVDEKNEAKKEGKENGEKDGKLDAENVDNGRIGSGDDDKHCVGRPVAFDVTVGEKEQPRKAPPRRLEKLEPIHRLTAEQLEEKQRAAEERKHKELEKKKMTKRDRLHRDIAEAREMERTKQISDIETRMNSVEKNRVEQRQAVVEKQKQHDEHVQRVREKAKRMNSKEDDLEGENGWSNDMEHDDTFNKGNEEDEKWWTEDVKSSGDLRT